MRFKARRVLAGALVALLSGVISCSDMPTAPRGNVTVEGVLADREGAALAGGQAAFVSLDPLRQGEPSERAYADAAGAYRIALAPGAYRVDLAPGYHSGIPLAVIPSFEAKGDHVRLDYRFTGTRITGQVTGPGGAPLSAGFVTAYPAQGGTAESEVVGGRYSLLLPPGGYELRAHSVGNSDGFPTLGFEVTVSAADSVIDFALTGNRVTTTVTLRGAMPLAGARVLVQATHAYAIARTGLDGVAVLYLPSGGYSYTVDPPFSHITGPETGDWSVSGDTPFAVDFARVQWDITLRRAADSSVIASAWVNAHELGSNRGAFVSADPVGKLQILARPGVGHDLQIFAPIIFRDFTVPNVFSAADSTFDLYVDVPVP